MKRPWDTILGHRIAIIILGLNLAVCSTEDVGNDELSRSIQISGIPLSKSGWRPVVGTSALGNYNFLGGNGKLHNNIPLTENKGLASSIVGVSSLNGELYHGGVLSTSSRPAITRDANKITSIAQTYKPTNLYSQNNINLNAPVNSYLNPFALNPNGAINPMKLTQNHPKDPMGVRLQGYRPLTKYQAQMKRIKQNQLQAAMMQQLASGHYHQNIQTSYHGSLKKPFDAYHKQDPYLQPHHKNHDKPLASQQVTKTKHPSVQASTYKPPLNAHYQNYELKDESFAPIPSSILGSFSSFGHASVKAREPIKNSAKSNYAQPSPTKQPTYSFNSSPTSNSAITLFHASTKEPYTNEGSKFSFSNSGFITNLYPPPRFILNQDNKQKEEQKQKTNLDKNKNHPVTFYPSQQDPIIKHPQSLIKSSANPLDVNVKPNPNPKYFFSISSLPKQADVRPSFASTPLFASTPSSSSTFDPYDTQSTNVIPDNLLVQVPPPYTSTTFHSQKPQVQVEVTKEKFNTYLNNIPPSQYNYQEFKYMPNYNPTQTTTSKNVPFRATYEVTETWGNSGEAHTQPTLHSWFDPAQSYKQYNTILRPNSPPPPSIFQDLRLVPAVYTPAPQKPDIAKLPQNTYSVHQADTEDNNYKQNDFFSQLENSLSSTADTDITTRKPVEKQPTKETYTVNINTNKPDTMEAYIETTTLATEDVTMQTQDFTSTRPKNKRRRPIQQFEMTTDIIPLDDDDIEMTTRYETYREQAHETENDLRVGALPTIPPNKHFKRPSAQPTQLTEGEKENKRKRLKHRRRRPLRPSSTIAETHLENYRGTQPTTNLYSTEYPTEDATKYTRPRMRFPSLKKPKPTKPSMITDSTSSAQPTVIPTTPINTKKRPIVVNQNRNKLTTLLPEEPEKEEKTTPKAKVTEVAGKESSIMKIAKDSHRSQPKTSTTPLNDYNIKETPDYSHKQDEKDTPTSDTAVNTGNENFSSQKLKIDLNLSTDNSQSQKPPAESDINKFLELYEHTTTTSSEQNHLSTAIIESNIKEIELNEKSKELKEDNAATEDTENNMESTSPSTPSNKTPRARNKGTKYENNRPRFSVKDYRNRLSQYTSSTTTEKPNEVTSTRLRFPNRRFPNFKDNSNIDIIPSASDVEISTDLPRKKFVPKEPRHKLLSYTSLDDEVDEATITEKPLSRSTVTRIRTTTLAGEMEENEIVTPKPRLRPNTRRDPNRARTTTTEDPKEITSQKTQQKVNSVYTNVKRINGSNIRKKVQNISENVDVVSTPPAINKNESSTEKQKSETAIMKIKKEEKKHASEDLDKASSEQSKRVSDLTLAASKDYNTPGLFKAVSPTSRRIPNYFTIATDDPILPIEAFFPQLNQKKES